MGKGDARKMGDGEVSRGFEGSAGSGDTHGDFAWAMAARALLQAVALVCSSPHLPLGLPCLCLSLYALYRLLHFFSSYLCIPPPSPLLHN